MTATTRKPLARVPLGLKSAYAESGVEENDRNLRVTAVVAILVFASYMALNLFDPGPVVQASPWLRGSYRACYVAAIVLSLAFVAWRTLAGRGTRGGATGALQALYVTTLLLCAVRITSLDLLHERDFSAISLTSTALALGWRAGTRRYVLVFGLAPFACVGLSLMDGAALGADLVLPVFISAGIALVAAILLESGRKRSFLLQEELREQSSRDPLTGLRNRRFLNESAELLVAGARRKKTPLCVLVIDIDHFKDVNDEKGHLAGDEVLRALGRELGASLRSSDLLVRFGGEEFLAILVDTGLDGGFLVAERIRARIAELEIPAVDRRVTVSCGLAALGEGESMEACMERADAKLYEAKRGGRNRTER
jgi:diguanylate cyclase (GGDEF)-like protein